MTHKQNKIVFLNINIGNLDDTVDFTDESPQTFDNVKKALNNAKKTTAEYGMRTCIYRCVPVYRVDRGHIRVTKL